MVHAGVYHQAYGAPDLVLQPTVFAVPLCIKADILRQPLRVKAPAFCVRGERRIFAEWRQIGQLGRDGELQMMPRHTFVIRNGLYVEQQPLFWCVLIYVNTTRTP